MVMSAGGHRVKVSLMSPKDLWEFFSHKLYTASALLIPTQEPLQLWSVQK